MNVAAVNLAIFVIQEAIALEPELQAEIAKLLTKANPTEDDWANLRNSVANSSYRKFVPQTNLPDDQANP